MTIKGKALNAKLGALIQTDTLIYYIDGVNKWPDNKYNKTITVTGDLYKTPASSIIHHDSIQVRGIPVKDCLEYDKFTLKNVIYK